MGTEGARWVEASEPAGRELLRYGWILAIAAVAFQTVAHLANEFVFDDRFEGIDADVEGGVFTWASSAAAFGVAFSALVHAAAFTRRRSVLLLVFVTASFFSLDDVVQIHERIALRVGEDLLGLPDYAAVRLWLLFYLPLLALLAALLWLLADEVWRPAGRAIRVGLLLLAASIPVEIAGLVTRRLEEDGDEVPDDLRVAVEEGVELGGWIVVAMGLAAAVAVALIRFRHDTPE